MRKNCSAQLLALALTMTMSVPTAVPAMAAKKPAPTKSIEITSDDFAMTKGQTKQLKAVTKPSKKVIWTSNNKKVVTVSKTGKVKALKNGNARIYAKTSDGIHTWVKVKVAPAVSKVTASKKSLTLEEGKTTTIKGTVSPKNAVSTKVKYYSSNKKIATVGLTGGKVTAKKAGKANIVIYSADRKKKVVVPITVKKAENVTKITANNVVDGQVVLANKTYDNLVIDKSVGSANISLDEVTVKNTLTLGDGADYVVTATNSNITNVEIQENTKVAKMAVTTKRPTFIIGKGSIVKRIIAHVHAKIKSSETGKVSKVEVVAEKAQVAVVELEDVKADLEIKGADSADTTVELTNCAIGNAILSGEAKDQKVALVDQKAGNAKSEIATLKVEETAQVELGVNAKAVEIAKDAKATTVKVQSGVVVDKVESKADSVALTGNGTVKEATISGNNTKVETAGTKVTVDKGVTGTVVNGKDVAAGETATTPSAPTGGGGSGSTGGNGGNTGGDTENPGENPGGSETEDYKLSVVSGASVQVNVGDTIELIAGVKTKDGKAVANGTSVAWTSSNEDVVKVDPTTTTVNGEATLKTGALKEGTATVTATYDGQKVHFEIEVEAKGENPGEGENPSEPGPTPEVVLGVEDKDVTLKAGETKKVTVTLEAGGVATSGSIEWASSDESLVKVTSANDDDRTATITAVAKGTATITVKATTQANKILKEEIKVTVTEDPTDQEKLTVTVNPTTVNLEVGSEDKATADVVATWSGVEGDATISWESKDDKVATVKANDDDSKTATITAVGTGNTTVTVTVTVGEQTATADVTVKVGEGTDEPGETTSPEDKFLEAVKVDSLDVNGLVSAVTNYNKALEEGSTSRLTEIPSDWYDADKEVVLEAVKNAVKGNGEGEEDGDNETTPEVTFEAVKEVYEKAISDQKSVFDAYVVEVKVGEETKGSSDLETAVKDALSEKQDVTLTLLGKASELKKALVVGAENSDDVDGQSDENSTLTITAKDGVVLSFGIQIVADDVKLENVTFKGVTLEGAVQANDNDKAVVSVLGNNVTVTGCTFTGTDSEEEVVVDEDDNTTLADVFIILGNEDGGAKNAKITGNAMTLVEKGNGIYLTADSTGEISNNNITLGKAYLGIGLDVQAWNYVENGTTTVEEDDTVISPLKFTGNKFTGKTEENVDYDIPDVLVWFMDGNNSLKETFATNSTKGFDELPAELQATLGKVSDYREIIVKKGQTNSTREQYTTKDGTTITKYKGAGGTTWQEVSEKTEETAVEGGVLQSSRF